MMDNYLAILEDSLKQKDAVLDRLLEYSNAQEALLKEEKFSLEEFDALVDEKDALIQKLTKLDEGFEVLFARIKNQLEGNKDSYRQQIASLQQLIGRVTEKSVSIQAQEKRNKTMVESHFRSMRQEMRQGRKSSKAAYGYYKSMSGSNLDSSQFYDNKQ